MIDRINLLNALDESRDSLNKLLLVIAMNNEKKLTYEEQEEHNNIQKLEKAISSFAENRLYKYIDAKINAINSRARSKLLTIDNKKIVLCNTEVLFYIGDNCYRETLEKFNAAEAEIEQRVQETVDTIAANHSIIKAAAAEVIKELRNQSFITNKHRLTFDFNEKNGRGTLDISFSYMGRETVTAIVNVSKLINPEDFLKELKTNVIKSLKQKIAVDRTQNIKRAINDICTDAHLNNINFRNFKKEAPKPWDFEQGYISFDLDLSNPRIARDFIRELITSVKAIEALYFSKFDHITSNKNISLGDNYYYRKKETREYEGETYDIYEGRVGTRKPLLFIVKNGTRIFGHRRNKLLREMKLNKCS